VIRGKKRATKNKGLTSQKEHRPEVFDRSPNKERDLNKGEEEKRYPLPLILEDQRGTKNKGGRKLEGKQTN